MRSRDSASRSTRLLRGAVSLLTDLRIVLIVLSVLTKLLLDRAF